MQHSVSHMKQFVRSKDCLFGVAPVKLWEDNSNAPKLFWSLEEL